jgi:hypothetical protein
MHPRTVKAGNRPKIESVANSVACFARIERDNTDIAETGGPGRLRRPASMAGGILYTSIAAPRGIGDVRRTDE